MKNFSLTPKKPHLPRFLHIRAIYGLYTGSSHACTGAVTPKKPAKTKTEAPQAPQVLIPNRIKKACNELSDQEKSTATLNRFLKTDRFLKAVIEHKKQYINTETEEYSLALKSLLAHYNAGQIVNINELTLSAIKNLEQQQENSIITRNTLRDSFVPLLKELNLIEGKKPLKWAYLDNSNIAEKAWQQIVKQYQLYCQKTDGQIELERAQKNQYFLKKAQRVIEENKGRQESLANQLYFTKKEDEKCRKQAHELGIPYSELKQKQKKQGKAMGKINIPQTGFVVVIALVIGIGVLGKSEKVESEEPIALDPMAEEITQMLGFTDEEHQWRQRYIALFKQYRHTPEIKQKRLPAIAEKELVQLSGDFMIPAQRLNEIISTIQPYEIYQ